MIADNLAVYVDQIFEDVHYYHGFCMVLAILFFTLQIYCDFSGYSDIAIGCARLFDVELMTNFKSPYFSNSIREFWTRWHISLSTWFRDYVYIPLGGNRVSKFRNCVNVMVTFLVSGLWHGAAFTYVIWGGIHGLLQIMERFFLGKKKMPKLIVFLLVAFAWTFFRAQSLSDAVYVLMHMFDGIGQAGYLSSVMDIFDLNVFGIVCLLIPIVLLFVYDYVALKVDPIVIISKQKPVIRWVIYYVFVLFILLFASFSAQEFVYFQF